MTKFTFFCFFVLVCLLVCLLVCFVCVAFRFEASEKFKYNNNYLVSQLFSLSLSLLLFLFSVFFSRIMESFGGVSLGGVAELFIRPPRQVYLVCVLFNIHLVNKNNLLFFSLLSFQLLLFFFFRRSFLDQNNSNLELESLMNESISKSKTNEGYFSHPLSLRQCISLLDKRSQEFVWLPRHHHHHHHHHRHHRHHHHPPILLHHLEIHRQGFQEERSLLVLSIFMAIAARD